RLDGGRWVRDQRSWKAMARVFARMDPGREPDRSFQEFLDERPGGRKLAAARRVARGFVQGFYAADPARISVRSLAGLGATTEEAARGARIVPGYAALVAHLEREVAGSVRLGEPVARIAWGEDGARVVTRDGARYRGRAAVVAVPLPELQEGGILFEPEIPSVRRAAGALVMGNAARVTLVLRERFWEERMGELSFVHAPGRRPFHVWWTTYPHLAPVLVGWSGGPPALTLLKSGVVEETAVREFARAFRLKRTRAEGLVESVHTHDWTHDPWIRGAYSYVGVGGNGAAKRLARPVGDTLFIAGEATDQKNIGTVEAALASGRRAAKQVLRAIG
ncbi:MAG TPA: NAD(P)/FAD-dependent oxidoreductase, partial [Gemmatimonadota bacterium]|nr:NAD(P)/FAD-dependent oxidoreductase [Gemmatimonadota bacterium]